MTKAPLPIMVCRSANEPMSSGSVRWGNCALCTEPLQVSATGQEQLRRWPDILMVCTPCGVAVAEVAQQRGALDGVLLSPTVKEQMSRLKTPDADRLRAILKKLG